MYCIDQWWIIELTIWAPRSQTSKRREISHLEYVYSSRQVRGNRLLIHEELYQRTLKQDVLKQRPSSLASKNICVDCLAIVTVCDKRRLQTCRPQTCRLADLQTCGLGDTFGNHRERGGGDNCPRRDFAQRAKSQGGILVTHAYIKESTYSWNIQSVC